MSLSILLMCEASLLLYLAIYGVRWGPQCSSILILQGPLLLHLLAVGGGVISLYKWNEKREARVLEEMVKGSLTFFSTRKIVPRDCWLYQQRVLGKLESLL